MDVQTIFYTLGIVFMSLMLIFMVLLVVVLLYIKSRITSLEKNIRQKIELANTVSNMGGKVVETAVGKLREFVEAKEARKRTK